MARARSGGRSLSLGVAMDEQLQMFGGDWTDTKLAIVRNYLSAYNTALKKQPFTRVYVDAFAGTGYREQTQERFRLPDLFQEVLTDGHFE